MNAQKLIVLLALILVMVSCKTNETITTKITESGDSYAGRFPDEQEIGQLNKISRTVKRIECLAFYKTYVFAEDNLLQIDSLTEKNLKKYAIASDITHTSVSGTATIIYYDVNRVAILTCAHVVNFPDTIYNRTDGKKTGLYSVAIKLREKIYVSGLPAGEDIQIVAMDEKNDIVLLKKELEPTHEKPKIFDMEMGKTEDLDWGTFVYIMGYPMGDLMITRAVVSSPDKIKHGTFITDALYNRGISGAPVFAFRKGISRFEWVGMAKSSSVDKFYYLRPDKDYSDPSNVGQLYSDSLYIESYTHINYGVAYSITIDAIKKFFNANKAKIKKAGIQLEGMRN